ncbi:MULTISPECIES: hypothetical protein [unclassified Mycoplasma]|uniref:hypothetical protein n=1 Tax=unclassified Mycoplasma TaxID=2683645 RepID=UPI00211CB650|nr:MULTISPECIES: hypothetical protein [unclassified Mycoplasma]UUM19753.1 hypothetical protein NPA11_03215 [Mycoplasma sp. 1578d]UUM24737.1 hypothetical protein NPA12_03510 [Mycoplasma sp. 3686d]
MFWLLSTFVDNDLSKLSANELDNIKVAKLLSYITNSLVIVFFCAYSYFLRHKIKAGYIFFIFWAVIFIGMAFVPFLSDFDKINTMQKIFGSFSSIFAILLSIFMLWYTIKLIIKRKVARYEMIQNIKHKRR